MTWIAGVDGCRFGWISALRDVESGRIETLVTSRFAELLAPPYKPRIVAVDMPVGLSDGAPRVADFEARRLLGPRRSSVFPTPVRAAIDATDYEEANAASRRVSGKGIGRQSFNLIGKIREVEASALEAGTGRIYECHPELCFLAMNGGQPLAAYKKTPEGLRQRRRLLEAALGPGVGPVIVAAAKATGVGLDDVHDALATLWSAGRILRGESERVPAGTPRDSLGLPMEINY
jgi:predicted RNase H-like nuclease